MNYLVLRDRISKERPDLDLSLIDEAYSFALKAHEGQFRYSGEPYINHPVHACFLLLSLNPDLASVQACLLHDVTEDTDTSLDEIRGKFGEDVAFLVEGMEKLSLVKFKKDSPQIEAWRKMFLAMAKDLRIVFIKLADRLHNMMTLEHVPEEKRERIAKESLFVHSAIASRLGIYQFKSELEDLCFKHLYPEEYKALSLQMAEFHEKSTAYMNFATSNVEQILFREGIQVQSVQGRVKHLWSIFQKMDKKGSTSLTDIYDLFAVRVILPDLIRDEEEQVSHLYTALGIIHSQTLPMQDRFKDYVAVPKPNGYRSLHTTVLGIGGDLYDGPTEVQIRSMQMHRESEIGIASHASYKLSKKTVRHLDRGRYKALHIALDKVKAIVKNNPELEDIIRDWVERYQHVFPEDRKKIENILMEKGLNPQDIDDIRKGRSQESLKLEPTINAHLAWFRGLADELENMNLDLFSDKIFVLTPSRDVMELPRGSTPVDFAYAVHTEVGNKMVNAKVNGRIVPLDYELKNGHLVEIGTRNNAKPNRFWVSLAKTASARAKIKNWFNKESKDSNIVKGRDQLNKELEKIGKKVLDDKLSLLKEYGGKKLDTSEREQILESIALAKISPSQLVKNLFGLTYESLPSKKVVQNSDKKSLEKRVIVTGEENLPVILSSCCKPKLNMPIIGYVTRGKSIRIHKTSCRELSGLEGERFVSAHWSD